MLNFKRSGFIKTRANVAAVASGEPISIGARVGVAIGAYAANEEGEYLQGGAVEFTKRAGLALVQGTVYGWDDGLKEIVPAGDAAEDFTLGEADVAAAGGDATGIILVNSTGYNFN